MLFYEKVGIKSKLDCVDKIPEYLLAKIEEDRKEFELH